MIEEIKFIEASQIENCVCEEVSKEEINEMLEIGKKMIEFCSAKGGIGLAAPQIGIFKKLFVYKRTEDTFQIIFNPSYIKLNRKPINVIESCMSYEKSYMVNRSKEIQAIYYTLDKNNKLIKKGEALKGEKAIMFQHECDHVNGITIKMIGEING